MLTVYFRISDRERQLSILYQKQGRTTQFHNKEARDTWLQKEIDDYERVMTDVTEQVGNYKHFSFTTDNTQSTELNPDSRILGVLSLCHIYDWIVY